MGGKRSKRGKGGGGRRKEGSVSVEGHSQNSAREPPPQQQQQRGRGSDNNGVNLPLHNSAREPPEEKQQQQQRSQNKHVTGRSSTSNRQPQEPPTSNQYPKYSNGNTNNSVNNSTRRTAGGNKISSSIRRQDPPQDETRSVSSRHSSTSRNNNNNNSDRRDRRKPNGHFNYYEQQYNGEDDENDSPLLDMQEKIQYDNYQDQHYHQQFLHPQQTNYRQDESPAYSSSHRQFNLAPLNVEMTTFNSMERKAKKDERRLRQQQKAQQSTFSLGRYETVNSSNHSSDNASDSDYDFDYNSGNSDDESSDHEKTTHEEFYNYDDDDDDDTDDEDEERPLRRSRSSNKLRQNHHRSQPIMTRCERYQNRALLVAFALVAVLFIRDQTPWWKRHQARVEYQKHHHHHKDGSDDDDSVRKTQLDPFTVYNSNDDDSTHTRDHDPLHKYVKEGETKLDPDAVAAAHGSSSHAENFAQDAKEENKYDEHTAGERISDRPAQKSLNHGFMDETYSNRPGAKNSASTSLAAAGVKIGSTGGLDEEEASFLKSVKGGPEGYNSGYGVDVNNEQMIPPPPPSNQDTPTETSTLTFSSEVRPESEDNTMQSSPADTNVDEIGFSEGKVSSFPTEVQTQQQSQQQQHMSPNDSDNLVEWGDPQRQNDGNGANVPPQSPQSNTFQPGSAVPDFKPMANEAMSGSAFMSNSLNAQIAKQIKDVYKNSYYRWNHPFRTNAEEGRDIPVFWRIPRSASSIMENVIVNCYHLSLASALGTRQGHDQDQSLGIVAVGNAKYVNVDMSNPAGIQRASAMHLGAYDMVDAISTPFLYETASIFQDVPNSGKCFTLLRHPVDRAVSLYHHYQSEDSNPNTLQYKGLSIDEFAEQTTESNWMVRFLTNKRAGALSWHDLEAAKEMFGRKCLVGLVEKAEESIRRFERYFGWGDSNYNACVGERLANSDKRNQHDSFEGTNAWEVLRKKNEYDVLLYEYAKNLYTQQSTMYEPLHTRK